MTKAIISDSQFDYKMCRLHLYMDIYQWARMNIALLVLQYQLESVKVKIEKINTLIRLAIAHRNFDCNEQ